MSPSECDQTISSFSLSSQQITRATYALLFLVALNSLSTHARLTWLRFLSTLRVSVESLVAIGCFSGARNLKFQVRRHGEMASTSPPFSFSNDIAPSTDEYTKPDSSTRLNSRGHPVELCAQQVKVVPPLQSAALLSFT
jgi:hypothetical protein